jgi:hypothetical protein
VSDNTSHKIHPSQNGLVLRPRAVGVDRKRERPLTREERKKGEQPIECRLIRPYTDSPEDTEYPEPVYW